MHITSLLSERSVLLDLDVASKEEAIEQMVAAISRSPKVLDGAEVLRAVLEREEMASTGIGEGIAIPHAKSGKVADMLGALAVTREPVDFQSHDDQPVRLIFLLVGVESRVGVYLKLLSRARRLMGNASFRKRLLQATLPSEVIDAFNEEEDRYFEAT